MRLEVMAERKPQRQVRCQNQYVYDRLSPEKVSQVYHWLVPEKREKEPSARIAVAENEKAHSHLRPSLF
jgi:hypothetical protein